MLGRENLAAGLLVLLAKRNAVEIALHVAADERVGRRIRPGSEEPMRDERCPRWNRFENQGREAEWWFLRGSKLYGDSRLLTPESSTHGVHPLTIGTPEREAPSTDHSGTAGFDGDYQFNRR